MTRLLIICLISVLAISFSNAQELLVDNFESYQSDAELDEVWNYSKAGGEDGLFYFLNSTNFPPEGSQCMELLIDMPAKWWYNKIQRNIENAPLDLTQYHAISFWIYGDSNLPEGDMIGACFLFDSQDRALRFEIPYEYLGESSWQEVTLALDSFVDEQWDSGYGTDNPDADRADIVNAGFMFVGNVDNVFATILVDDIRFVQELESATVQGTVTELDNPMEDVTVMAIGQNTILETQTNESGNYSFTNLLQGRSYRILPVKDGYTFEPGVTVQTLLNPEYTFDFEGVLSIYNDLDTETVQDQFDETGLNPDIIYRTSAPWQNPGNERPVIDVTQDKTYLVGFPDGETAEAVMPAIEPNSLEGAASPGYAVEVGLSYAWDMLIIGQNTNSNYFVEVDAYCELRDELETGFDRVSLGVRCNATDPDEPVLDAAADTVPYYSSGGYALSYESDIGEIIARKYYHSNDTAHVLNRFEGFAEDYASIPITESGWHRLSIACQDETIIFYVDGEEIATVTDSEYQHGPAGLHYRACFPDFAGDLQDMYHARFDNLTAGPSQETAVNTWMLN